ncbi:MAG: hypothetical protein FWF51_08790 [Chitinivibrionia bacterium]|nr:hypothetical protein [Chitinivibrionia bacterium]
MKKAFWNTELFIDTNRVYSEQELFEYLKEKLGNRYKAIFTEKVLTVETIYIEGEHGWVHIFSHRRLSAKRGRIIITMGEPLKKMEFKLEVKDVLLCLLFVVTLGIAFAIYKLVVVLRGIFNLEGTKENRNMMREIAEEIEKFVTK